MQKTVSLKLGLTTQEKNWGRSESLGDLLNHARDIIDGRKPGDSRPPITSIDWLSRRAIEAVCREIIRTGQVTCPLRVRFVQKANQPFGFDPDLFSRN